MNYVVADNGRGRSVKHQPTAVSSCNVLVKWTTWDT